VPIKEGEHKFLRFDLFQRLDDFKKSCPVMAAKRMVDKLNNDKA